MGLRDKPVENKKEETVKATPTEELETPALKAEKPVITPAIQALINKQVIEAMAKVQAANAGDTQALEDIAASSDVADDDDVLPNTVHFFSNQRLWLKNYRRNGREVKLPFGGEGFMFRLIDSRVDGPEKDKREHCIYALFTNSKKELAHIKGHPWYDNFFWEDARDATKTTSDEITWQMDAWHRLENLGSSAIIAEVKNLQLAGHNIKVSPDINDTRKQLLPIYVQRLKKERADLQLKNIGQMNKEAGEEIQALSLAYGSV